MRLLVVTQIVDIQDPVLGFFHRWIEELGTHAESVEVVCLKKGTVALPPHIHVHSLGKEEGKGRVSRMVTYLGLIWRLRKKYDTVFVHMNPEYVLAGAPLWRLTGKEVGFWYAHGAVTKRLRVAEKLVHHIFTSTPHGCRMVSKKIHVVGQGIDTELFSPHTRARGSRTPLRAVTVSRLARSKDIDFLLQVILKLKDEGVLVHLSVIGGPLTTDDTRYEKELRATVARTGLHESVTFVGAVAQKVLPDMLREEQCFLNAYKNKSLDKALLEAMASGLPTISSNASYRDIIMSLFSDEETRALLCPPEGDRDAYVHSVRALAILDDARYADIARRLREHVVNEHGIQALFERIVSFFG